MFGYLDMLIIWKWFKFSPDQSREAPNLLINLINMYLGKTDDLKMYESEVCMLINMALIESCICH